MFVSFAYVAMCAHVYRIQNDLLYTPILRANNSEVLTAFGMEPVTVSTEDNIILTGWWLPPTSQDKVIVYFHGNGQIVTSSYHGIGSFAKEQGYGLLMAEYRGFAGHEGDVNEENLYYDADLYMQWLTKERSYQPEDLIIVGGSLGTAMAARTARKYNPYAVILFAPFSSILDLAKDVYWYLPVSFLLTERFRSDLDIQNVHAPLLILHGKEDLIVPERYARTLYELSASRKKEFIALDGAKHEGVFSFGASERMETFLSRLNQ